MMYYLPPLECSLPPYLNIQQHRLTASMNSAAQRKLTFAKKVMETFSQVQIHPTLQKSRIYELVKCLRENHQWFMYAFEQGYLRIFQSFHDKANRKIPSKFESLAEGFFEAVLTKKLQQQIDSPESIRVLEVFNSFIALCSEGIYSSVMNIRVMCCRLVFLLVKQIPHKKMEYYLQVPVQQALMNATLHIIRNKVSTYRQLGIKLASLILHFDSQKCAAIEKEMFKILSIQENQQIRKLVITNLSITKDNLQDILIRLRDKNPQIRSIVAKKLQGEKFKLENMSISNLYKLLYDGYGSKEVAVKKQCLRYFSMFFLNINSTMIEDQSESRNYHKQFVEMFRPDMLLLNPHLYHLFDELIFELEQQLEATMKDYIRKACYELKSGNMTYQIIWLKNAVNSKSREISKIYDELGPTGVDLSKVLINLAMKNQAFAIFQLLQLFARQKMPDEIGRNKMFDALKVLLTNLKHFQLQPSYEQFKDTDICHIMTSDQINRKKLMLSYYDMPIISNSLDLIFQIGQAMKSLRPDHYEIQMKQVMSEWHNPEENTLQKQRDHIIKNIQELREKDKNLLPRLREKLQAVQLTIEHESEKTRKVLMCICRLKYNCDLQIFMSIIKEELNKQQKSNGLLLLGLYCLQNKDKVQIFWKVFWEYISADTITEQNKNHVLVSLKVVIDFIVKFNSLSGPFCPQDMQDFNADMFMDSMVKLMLHEDADIRILAIQSLCRLLYHERVDKNNQSTYFLYLILLWLQTSTEVVSAKSVHTVSIFMKSYIEKGNQYSMKLSEIFCLFFKVMTQFFKQKKGINKNLIRYNLTMEQFIRKTLFTVMTIFKYQKESKNVIWVYNPDQSQIGPQQFLLIYFLKDQQITQFLGKALNQCDFFQFCGLETLIMTKKIIEEINETKKFKGVLDQTMKKMQEDIQRQISLKNSQIFNDNVVESLQKQNQQKMRFLNDEARYVHKNISDRNLFIKIDDDESDEQSEDPQQQQSSQKSSVKSDEDVEQQKQRVEESIRNRRRKPVFDLQEQDKQVDEISDKLQGIKNLSLGNDQGSEQQNQQPPKATGKAQKGQKKVTKKQMPTPLIRNLRKRNR